MTQRQLADALNYSEQYLRHVESGRRTPPQALGVRLDAQQCVEIGTAPGQVGIRDTKNRAQGHLAVRADGWKAFVSSVLRWFGRAAAERSVTIRGLPFARC